jgi:hypothetical protein
MLYISWVTLHKAVKNWGPLMAISTAPYFIVQVLALFMHVLEISNIYLVDCGTWSLISNQTSHMLLLCEWMSEFWYVL